jgi:hypothetical protein
MKSTGSYIFKSRQSSTMFDDLGGVDLAFIGECVDDRGTATIDLLKDSARILSSLRFEASSQQTFLDGSQVLRQRLVSLVKDKPRILMDATTLGLGEILQILLAVGRAGNTSVEFLYTEPKRYTQKPTENLVNWQARDFHLTENRRFVSLQGFAHQYEPSMIATHVFLLGFEPGRVLNAIEERGDFNQEHYHIQIIIGVPAFQAGWESNTIRPHLALFDSLQITEKSTTYCQANSIREAYLTLWELYRKMGDERGCFFVSPLGTKPHSVGTALFLYETRGQDIPTSLYYDHPVRVHKRSSNIGTWHHVKVELLKK